MKNKLLLVVSFACIVLINPAKAQFAKLGFDSTQCFFPNTIIQDSSFVNSLAVISVNGVPYSGTITVMVNTMDSLGNLTLIDSSYSQQTSVTPGTVTNLVYMQNYSSQHFGLGIDVVVIWPKAAGTLPPDTIIYTVFVMPNGIADLLNQEGVSIYPNPCTAEISIQNKQPNNAIEQVRIFDINGKLILTSNTTTPIDVSELKAAGYLVELRYKSGTRKIMKIQKE